MADRPQLLNIYERGSGEPILLFVHGLGCAVDDWDAQFAAFAPEFRCISIDLPGHGGSALPQTPNIMALASAVNTARERLGGRKTVLIGHSLGCKVIREAYCTAPNDIAGMVMLDGRHYGGNRDEQMAKLNAAIAAAGYVNHMRHHFDDMFVATTAKAVRDKIVARALALDPNFATGLLRDAIDWDYVRGEPTLAAIDVPVLALQSTYVDADRRRRPIEPGIRTHFMDLLEQLVPGAEVGVVTESGHFPMIERSAVVNKAIRQFLDRI